VTTRPPEEIGMTPIHSKIALPLALLALAAAPAVAAGAERDRPAGRAAKLQRAIDRVVAAGAPGTLALVRERDRTIRLASGYADLKARRPMRATDRFRIGSVTKTFVATVVLQLVGEGRLSLTDTVEGRLPGLVPNGQAITVRQLLNMTSGLFDYPKDPRIFAPFLQGDLAHAWAPRELVAVATSHAPLFAPGTGYAYCNTCYVLLGLMIEAASDNPLKAELRQRILEPLRLHATSFATTPRIAGRHARGYMRVGQPSLEDVTALSPSWGWAAGAIASTADDVARFYRALLGGRLLRPKLLRAMRTTVAGNAEARYGLGIGTLRLPCSTAWGHQGGIIGYDAWALASRDGRRQTVVFTNLEGSSFPKRAAAARDRLIATAYCG
jgi:D-alanyl-D-alanine carboxypeptidase